MFFELENHICEIVGVDHIVWSKQNCVVQPREYSALAFRIKGSGTISYDEGEIFVDLSLEISASSRSNLSSRTDQQLVQL